MRSSRAPIFRLTSPKGSGRSSSPRNPRSRSAGQDLCRDAGLGLARLSDGALSARLSRRSCPRSSTTPTSPSTARCSAVAPATRSLDARRASARQPCSAKLWARLYVAKYFPPEAKAKAEQLVANLLKAYDADIARSLDGRRKPGRRRWRRCTSSRRKIGYPDKWRDYSILQDRARRRSSRRHPARRFRMARELKRLDDPVDKAEWGMTPPTINAYYNPNR